MDSDPKRKTKKELDKMTPERRKMYEEIIKLRKEIGPVDINILEELRKLRNE